MRPSAKRKIRRRREVPFSGSFRTRVSGVGAEALFARAPYDGGTGRDAGVQRQPENRTNQLSVLPGITR